MATEEASRDDPAGALDDAAQFVEAYRFQFLSYLRTYRFLALLGLTLALTAAVVGIALYQGFDATRTGAGGSIDAFFAERLSFTGLLIVLSASFFGGDALSTDFGSGTGYFTLVLPVRRPVLLLGRYAAAYTAAAVLLIVHYALIGALGWAIFGTGSTLFVESFLLAALYVAAILSLAITLGAFFRRPVVALVATVLLLIFAFPIVELVVEQASIEPWFLVSYAGGAITNLFHPIVHSTTVSTGAVTIITYSATVAEAAGIMLGYTVVGLLLALLLYDRKEVTG